MSDIKSESWRRLAGLEGIIQCLSGGDRLLMMGFWVGFERPRTIEWRVKSRLEDGKGAKRGYCAVSVLGGRIELSGRSRM